MKGEGPSRSSARKQMFPDKGSDQIGVKISFKTIVQLGLQ